MCPVLSQTQHIFKNIYFEIVKCGRNFSGESMNIDFHDSLLEPSTIFSILNQEIKAKQGKQNCPESHSYPEAEMESEQRQSGSRVKVVCVCIMSCLDTQQLINLSQ